ncbi:MAG: hypothetical protein HY591_07190 [Candidatus Omnitrophica bacterium]|nr:hypothetical protein [Candidatus Omnitrophota bacterium]
MSPLFLTGCMPLKMLPYLDQALVLQEFGREKDAQHLYVKNVDAQFDSMLAAVESGDIQKYKTEQEIVKTFGPPVLSREVEAEGKDLKQCLYRYAIAHKGPRKIYLYYDQSGGLDRFELI